ncbi:hypothetical protein QMA69_31055, partial [Burkholderia pseudomallei]|uniref:hypothetical protein n=1 Tax=Burkholderia pseudomallei TaxID=28450 RepID=UPI002DBBEF57
MAALARSMTAGRGAMFRRARDNAGCIMTSSLDACSYRPAALRRSMRSILLFTIDICNLINFIYTIGKNKVHRRKPWSLGERLRNLTPDFMDVR